MMSPIFSFFSSPGHQMVRRRPGVAYKPRCLACTVRLGGETWRLYFCASTFVLWNLFHLSCERFCAGGGGLG